MLLAWIDAPGAATGVAAKLVQALQQPFHIAGHAQALAIAVGLSLYPEHGRTADELLRRALGQAAAAGTGTRAGFVNRVERGAVDAANDE